MPKIFVVSGVMVPEEWFRFLFLNEQYATATARDHDAEMYDLEKFINIDRTGVYGKSRMIKGVEFKVQWTIGG